VVACSDDVFWGWFFVGNAWSRVLGLVFCGKCVVTCFGVGFLWEMRGHVFWGWFFVGNAWSRVPVT
jgi:hypothetical protein